MMNTKKLSTFKRLFMLSVVLVLSLASTLTLTACGSKIPENTVFSARFKKCSEVYQKVFIGGRTLNQLTVNI